MHIRDFGNGHFRLERTPFPTANCAIDYPGYPLFNPLSWACLVSHAHACQFSRSHGDFTDFHFQLPHPMPFRCLDHGPCSQGSVFHRAVEGNVGIRTEDHLGKRRFRSCITERCSAWRRDPQEQSLEGTSAYFGMSISGSYLQGTGGGVTKDLMTESQMFLVFSCDKCRILFSTFLVRWFPLSLDWLHWSCCEML